LIAFPHEQVHVLLNLCCTGHPGERLTFHNHNELQQAQVVVVSSTRDNQEAAGLFTQESFANENASLED